MNKDTSKVRMLVLTGMFTAVVCVMSQISIPTQPIPFTLSVFSIFFVGSLLPPRYAFLSVMAYILLGAFGAPVFAGFRGGIHVLAGMTGGYIAAYPLMAVVTSVFYRISGSRKLLWRFLGMMVSLLFCYLIGTCWFVIVSGTSFSKALSLCVIPFFPFDIVKAILALSMSAIIRRVLDRYAMAV